MNFHVFNTRKLDMIQNTIYSTSTMERKYKFIKIYTRIQGFAKLK